MPTGPPPPAPGAPAGRRRRSSTHKSRNPADAPAAAGVVRGRGGLLAVVAAALRYRRGIVEKGTAANPRRIAVAAELVALASGREGAPERDALRQPQPALTIGVIRETLTRMRRAGADRPTPPSAGGAGGAPSPEFQWRAALRLPHPARCPATTTPAVCAVERLSSHYPTHTGWSAKEAEFLSVDPPHRVQWKGSKLFAR